jgi:hypothetical protein
LFRLIKVDTYESCEITIAMPNGEIIKIAPEKYVSKEIKFGSKNHIVASNFLPLFKLTFKAYYDYGKEKSLERRTVEEKKPPITQSWIRETPLDREHYKEVLKEEYQNYKQNKYNFGGYGTRDQIRLGYYNIF